MYNTTVIYIPPNAVVDADVNSDFAVWHGLVCNACKSLLVFWSPGVLVSWSPGLLVSWSPGRLVSWSPDLLISWSPGRLILSRPSVRKVLPIGCSVCFIVIAQFYSPDSKLSRCRAGL